LGPGMGAFVLKVKPNQMEVWVNIHIYIFISISIYIKKTNNPKVYKVKNETSSFILPHSYRSLSLFL
jgi:hypothetical protein